MRNGFQKKSMGLMLSALVLAWGVVPPGFEHAHAGGGDSNHRHDVRHNVKHQDGHHHDHDAHHHDSDLAHHVHPADIDVMVFEEDVRHIHWQLLGVEFSLPLPTTPAEGEREENVPPMVVRAMNEVVSPTQTGPPIDRVLLVGNCAPGADVVCNLEPIPRSRNFVTSIPLCDSARLERSGVLLA